MAVYTQPGLLAKPRLLAGGILDLLILSALFLTLAGCGGGGGGTGGVGVSGRSGTPITPDQRAAALTAVEGKLASLPHTHDMAEANAMASFLATRPEFEATGVEPDGSAWGRFTDGRLLVVTDNLVPSSGKSASVAIPQSRSATIPNSITYRVFNCNGNAFNEGPPIVLDKLLSSAGYAGLSGSGTLDDFKHIHGVSVLYVDSHGGAGKDRSGKDVFSIRTSTRWTKDIEALPEWQDGSIVYMTAQDNVQAPPGSPQVAPVNGTNVAVTARFVQKNWKFASNSFVYLDCCSSDNDDFKAACFAAGAMFYAGWSRIVVDGDRGPNAIRVFKDLTGIPGLTGPPINPQSIADMKFDLATQKLGVSDNQFGRAFLNITGTQDSDLDSALVPIIQFSVADDNQKTLTLTGVFPIAPGKVLAGGAPVHVQSWTPEQIVADEPGTLHNIQVVADSRVSNIVTKSTKLTLSPATNPIQSNAKVPLTAVLENPPQKDIAFHWTTTGKNGNLVDQHGHAGNDLDTVDSTVTFLANPNLQSGVLDTVSVEVKAQGLTGGARRFGRFGKANATIQAPIKGRFFVDSTTPFAGDTPDAVNAVVAFPLVPGTKVYKVHCHGWAPGPQTPFPSGTLDFTFTPPSSVTYQGKVFPSLDPAFFRIVGKEFQAVLQGGGNFTGPSAAADRAKFIKDLQTVYQGIVVDVFPQ